jgi:hypothetical protein
MGIDDLSETRLSELVMGYLARREIAGGLISEVCKHVVLYDRGLEETPERLVLWRDDESACFADMVQVHADVHLGRYDAKSTYST